MPRETPCSCFSHKDAVHMPTCRAEWPVWYGKVLDPYSCSLTLILPQTLDLALVTEMTRALQNVAQSSLCWQEFLAFTPHTPVSDFNQKVQLLGWFVYMCPVFPKTHQRADSTQASLCMSPPSPALKELLLSKLSPMELGVPRRIFLYLL